MFGSGGPGFSGARVCKNSVGPELVDVKFMYSVSGFSAGSLRGFCICLTRPDVALTLPHELPGSS